MRFSETYEDGCGERGRGGRGRDGRGEGRGEGEHRMSPRGEGRHGGLGVMDMGMDVASVAAVMTAKAGVAGGALFDAGQLRLVLLKLISGEPRHGYELIRAIEELTGGAYVPSPGVVYPTLTLLQEMGQIDETKTEGPRKNFAITADGHAHLDANAAEVERLFARLADLAAERQRADAGPVRRALDNLERAAAESGDKRYRQGDAARYRGDPR